MRLQHRIFIIFAIISGISLYLLINVIVKSIQPNYREALESPVVDMSEVLAAIVSQQSQADTVNYENIASALKLAQQRQVNAKIFSAEKNGVDLRIYITNEKGIVLYHSSNPSLIGSDFSKWNDVVRTLRGEYGARTTRDNPDNPNTTVFYVAAPIKFAEKIIGVLTVGKPAFENNQRASIASNKILAYGLLTGALSILAACLISFWIFRPLRMLTNYIQDLQLGKRVSAPGLEHGELAKLLSAFEDLKSKLEGKNYVEQYLKTLTHELKSPLSGIKASSELLGSELTGAERERFLALLNQEVDRIDHLINSLLNLAKIERISSLPHADQIELGQIVNAAIERESRLIVEKSLKIIGAETVTAKISADQELLTMAISSIIRNAAEFSPENGVIEFACERAQAQLKLHILDSGPGIPQFALEKLFTRFYSLPRPTSAKKSSGLGLLLAREVLQLHNATVVLFNRTDRSGVEVILTFNIS